MHFAFPDIRKRCRRSKAIDIRHSMPPRQDVIMREVRVHLYYTREMAVYLEPSRLLPPCRFSRTERHGFPVKTAPCYFSLSVRVI